MPSDYVNELTSKVGLDVTEWKKGITELTAGVKKIETSFQASAALMDNWSGSSEGLKSRIESLNGALTLQKKKLEILKSAYEDVVEKEGATSNAAKSLAAQMFKAREDIEKTTDKLKYYTEAEQKVIDKTAAMVKKLEESGNKFEKTGDKINKVGNKITLGITTPVIAAGAAIYKYSSDLTEAENKTKEVLKNMSGDVLSWSETSLDKMGMARSTALDAVSLYGGMATAMGLTRKKATDMSKSLTELSVDLASFHNTSLDQASTALKSIFTGETGTLKNYGIVMTEANLKAYALSQGIKTNYTEMTQAEKVQLRYNFVLNASKDAIGDYERNCGEAASQMKKLPEALKELATSFKDNVEPAITPVITALNGAIVSFGKWSETTKNVVTVTAVTIAALGPLVSIIGKTTSAIGKAEKAFAKIYARIKKKTAATVEDTAANAANAKSLDKTAESAETAAKSTGKIGTAAKSVSYDKFQRDFGNGISVPSKGEKWKVSIRIISGYTADNLVFKPQIELGSTATAYTPYISDLTTITVTRCGKNLFDKSIPISSYIRLDNSYKYLKYYVGTGTNVTVSIAEKPTVPNDNGFMYVYPDTTPKADANAKWLAHQTSPELCNQQQTVVSTDGYVCLVVSVARALDCYGNSIQIELGTTATEYEPYKMPTEYTPAVDGTVSGVKSLYPTTTLMTDTEGAIIEAEYNRDINKAFAELQQAILSMGGNT